MQDYVWLNVNLIAQMGTIDVSCMQECLRLGQNQSDTDDLETGCKLRPDEGLVRCFLLHYDVDCRNRVGMQWLLMRFSP